MKPANAWNPRWRLLACVAPAAAFFTAFWLLPVVRLLALPADKGWATYFAVLTDSRYLQSMVNTVVLSVAVTLATLVLGAAVGIYLARHAFLGKRVLLSLLTLPLSFPGVIIGFFVILLGGRQGLVADVSDSLIGERITFAYGCSACSSRTCISRCRAPLRPTPRQPRR
jgi:putative spermidine/putrescine transport system permease protein